MHMEENQNGTIVLLMLPPYYSSMSLHVTYMFHLSRKFESNVDKEVEKKKKKLGSFTGARAMFEGIIRFYE